MAVGLLRFRRSAIVVLLLVFSGMVWIAPPAAPACYPKGCPGVDVHADAISSAASLERGRYNTVQVDASNDAGAADTDARISLKAKPRTSVRPKRVQMWMPGGESVSVFFGVKPKKKAPSPVDLTACAKAKADIDKTNDCVAASVPVT